MNRTLDAGCAEFIAGRYFEVVAAPDFEERALEILSAKKNLRVIRIPALARLEKMVGTPFLDIKHHNYFLSDKNCLSFDTTH